MRVLYLDSLFVFNFALNYLLLQGTRRVLHEDGSRRRAALGAAAGALYAVVCVLPFGRALSAWPLKLLSGGAVVLLTFGMGGRARTLRRLVAFFCLSAALGGGVLGLYYLLGNGSDFALYNGIAYLELPLLFFALAFAVIYPLSLLSYRLFTTGTGVTQQLADVVLVIQGHRIEGKGLIDTGCSLTEPLSGRQAVVVQRLLLHRLYPNPVGPEQLGGDYRLVPFSTVGEQGFLPAVRCESLAVTCRGQTVLHHNIYAAITDRPLSPDGSYHILLGHAIMAGSDQEVVFHDK